VAVWLELLLNGQLVGGTHLSGPCPQSGEVIYFTLENVVLAQVRSGGGSRLIQEPLPCHVTTSLDETHPEWGNIATKHAVLCK
jgi:hypothetical protein